MFTTFKKHFIPHAGNNHRSHILRKVSVRTLFSLILFFLLVLFLLPVLIRFNIPNGIALALPIPITDLSANVFSVEKQAVMTFGPIFGIFTLWR